MEVRTVSDLRKNLEQVVLDLGADPKFEDNPAFSNVLKEIQRLIGNMQIGDKEETLSVHMEDHSAYFKYNNPENKGENFEFLITLSGANKIVATLQHSNTEYDSNQHPIRKRSTTEINSYLDKYGFITIDKKIGLADNIDCDKNQYNITPIASRDVYNNNGLMQEHEQMTSRKVDKIPGNIDFVPGFSQVATMENRSSGYYAYYTKWTRDSIDTAQVYVDDKDKGIEYKTVMPLSLQHGPRRMEIQGLDEYPEEVIIPTIDEKKIQQIIDMEKNEAVREGLKKYVSGRSQGENGIYYDSNNDPKFIREGLEEEKSFGISK